MPTGFLRNKTFQFPKHEMGFLFFLPPNEKNETSSVSFSVQVRRDEVETQIKVCEGFEMLMSHIHNYFPCFH